MNWPIYEGATMTWGEFQASLLFTVATALAVVGTAATSYLITYLKVRKLEALKRIEELDRDTLHSAVRTGIQDELELDPNASDKQVAIAAAKHVLNKGAPDAVRAFDLSGSDLSRLIVSKVGEE